MSTGYKIQKVDSAYYVTFQIIGWVDLFTRKAYKDIAIDSLKYCQNKKGLLFLICNNVEPYSFIGSGTK